MSHSSQAYDEIIKKMTNQVIDQIEKEIENQVIDIAEHQMDVNQIILKEQVKKKRSKRSGRKASLPTLQHIRQMKQQKLIEFKQIEKQEDEIKKSAILNQQKIKNSSTKLMRSNFTQEQMHEIKKIIQNQKKNEKKLKKKQENYQLWLQTKRIQEQQSRKRYLAQQCQQRKKQLKKQREEQEKRKFQQKIQLQQQIKKLQEVKVKRLLHDQLSQSWRKYEQASQVQKQKIWLRQKQRRKFNSKEIKDHQQKYLSLIKEQQKKREQSLAQSRSVKHHLPYIHSSFFYKVQKEQEQLAKIQQVKIHDREDNVIKKKIYSKQVKELFLPKVKSINNNSPLKKYQKIISCNRTLIVEDKYKLGNEYMKLAHEKVTSEQTDKLKNSLVILEQPGGYSSHYKNYLKDLKTEHHKENNQNTYHFVQSTLKDKHLSSTDKLHKVKMIFLKDNQGKQTDRYLIDTIRNKMKVLQELIR